MSNTTADAYAHIETSIGKLVLFDLIVKNNIDMRKELPQPLKKLSSKELFKLYLPYFAYLEKDLQKTKLKRPKDYLLKQEDVDKLSDNELEALAEIFMEYNSYLYEKSETATKHKEDGTLVLNLDKEVDEDLIKRDDETYIDWFYRLILHQDKKEREQMKAFTSSFSSIVSKDMFKTIKMGKSLSNTLKSIKNSSYLKPSIREHNIDVPVIDFIDIERKKEERRLAPFIELSSKMDAMVKAEQQTVLYMEQTNLTQANIDSELKSSSKTTNRISKLNIFLTLVVIGLTVYTIWFSKDSKILIDTNKNIKYSINETNKNINNLANTLIMQNEIQNKKIDLLQKELRTLKMIKKEKVENVK